MNADSEEMRALCEASGVKGLPYFRFHASGQLVDEFPANLHKVGKLRDEIAAMKAKLAAEEAQQLATAVAVTVLAGGASPPDQSAR